MLGITKKSPLMASHAFDKARSYLLRLELLEKLQLVEVGLVYLAWGVM